MAEYIKLPGSPSGTPEQQLQQMYSFLYQMAQTMNVNLKEIGNAALTDEETELMNRITAAIDSTGKAPELTYSYAEAESLKSLIIKTAQFVKDEADNIRAVLFGEESAEGQYGNWKRKKGLRVDVTPDGVKQTYSYAEIVQGLKTFEINAKNYIKTGFLRTENLLPVYGVAIGKDVVTFAEDGTETYNDSNKVAELTADALSFYQGGNIVAKYTGNKLSFYIGGSEIFYIQSGKIYCAQDLELASGKKLIINTTNFKVDSSGNVTITGKIAAGSGSTFAGTMSADCITSGSIDASVIDVKNINASKITSGTMSANKISGGSIDASNVTITNLNASNITSGTMSANKISGGSIDASNVTITNLNASNISSGTMSANKISGGTLTLGGNNNTNGTLVINNASGTQIGKWDKDGIQATTGTFRGKLEAADGTFEVNASSKSMKIGDINNGQWTLDDTGIQIAIKDSNNPAVEHISKIEKIPGQSKGFIFKFEDSVWHDGFTYTMGSNAFVSSISSSTTKTNIGTSNDPWGEVYCNKVIPCESSSSLGNSSKTWDDIWYVNLHQVSSRERKHNIQPLPDRSAALDALQPVEFVYNDDAEERKRAGLIYEDTLPVMPEICTGDEKNKAINYVELIPYLLKEIQDLRKRVKALEDKEDR